MFRDTSGQHHVGHRLDAEAIDPTCDANGQAFPDNLIDQGDEAEPATVMCLRPDKVVAPDMIAMLWPQADARSAVQPQPDRIALAPAPEFGPAGFRTGSYHLQCRSREDISRSARDTISCRRHRPTSCRSDS